MSDFKAKVHQIRFPLGLHPTPCWGSLHRSLSVFKGVYFWWQGKRKGEEGQRRARKGRGYDLTRMTQITGYATDWITTLSQRHYTASRCDTSVITESRGAPIMLWPIIGAK